LTVGADADRKATDGDAHADPSIPVFDMSRSLTGHGIITGQEKRESYSNHVPVHRPPLSA
jgi:hypothetical protein